MDGAAAAGGVSSIRQQAPRAALVRRLKRRGLVTGWVTTLATARQTFPGEWGADPGTNGNRAVIIANVVRAVDGAELASRP